MVWHTPKGIIDEGGKVLEGYVNFNITLMAPPEDDRMAVSPCQAALNCLASYSCCLAPLACAFLCVHPLA